ncbi:replication initiation protein, partial [Helicobacter pylori]|uniref:replication initiation protein n=1 Tax=Helicobacter pylori TaxID=210 RepID=UPI00117B580F
MEFDQLESQRSDLQKVLKELDTLPQTPQIELQKQEIQDRINKITDTIIKELLSKHEIKKEELEPTLTPKPTPTKAPQTTPTPCKNLVVSTPKDKTYTTYHNNANKIVSDKETREFLYMDIQLNTGYNYLLNNLGMGGQYTSFKLLEFQRVRGKYAKMLYRLLKQYKSTGILSVEWSQFRELLDIPKDYKMENIDQKVLTPALRELHKIYPFEHLSYKKERRSHDKRKVTHIDFYFEQLPQGETKKQKQDDKQRAKRDIKLIAWDIKRQGIIKRSKETLEVREMDL